MTTPMSLQPWWWQIFHLNTTVVAIFPKVCLWRRSLCSDLTLKNSLDSEKLYRATFICQDGLCCGNMALISFRLFRKNLGNLRDVFGLMVYRPPWQKISRTPMLVFDPFCPRHWLEALAGCSVIQQNSSFLFVTTGKSLFWLHYTTSTDKM